MQNTKEKVSGIYCIENKINHKKYIGQSKNIHDRWRRHKSELNHGTHDNDYLQKSWNKYGEENFEFYILEECSIEDLNDRERYHMDKHDVLNREHGYNLKAGGQDCGKISEYSEQKKRESLRKYNETVKAVEVHKNSALKQWANPEIKAKIMGENNGMYGKNHSEETRRKMSEKRRERLEHRKNKVHVLCIELNKVFDCYTTAEKELGIKNGNVFETCKGNRKTAGGYHWRFLIEEK